MSPRIVAKERKAVEISQAALRVFVRRGYHRTVMSEVAEEAGVGKGTLYEYFKSKESLFRFIFDRFFDEYYEGVLGVLSEMDDPGEQLAGIVEFSAKHFDRWNDVCTIWLDFYSEMRWKDEEGGREIRRVYEVMRELLGGVIRGGQATGVFRRDVNPSQVASILLAVFDGLIMQHIFDPDCFCMEILEKTARVVLVEGVRES